MEVRFKAVFVCSAPFFLPSLDKLSTLARLGTHYSLAFAFALKLALRAWTRDALLYEARARARCAHAGLTRSLLPV